MARFNPDTDVINSNNQLMVSLLCNRNWQYIEGGFDADGVKSATGWRLFKFHIIMDTDTGEEIIVGTGELLKYTNLSIPSKVAATSVADLRAKLGLKGGNTPKATKVTKVKSLTTRTPLAKGAIVPTNGAPVPAALTDADLPVPNAQVS